MEASLSRSAAARTVPRVRENRVCPGLSLFLTMNEKVEAVYRAESRRVFATLVRLLGDFDLAEEALAEAFRAAIEQWPADGIPENPRAWLVSAGLFKAIDGIRRQARFDLLGEEHSEIADESISFEKEGIED